MMASEYDCSLIRSLPWEAVSGIDMWHKISLRHMPDMCQ